jgi:hypothetical protein
MSERKLRPRPPRAPSTEPIEDDDFEPQEVPSTSKRPSKGKQPVKKARVTKNHSPPPADPQVCPPGQPQPSGATEFHPIIPHTAPHSAYNTLPAYIRNLYALEPENIFRLFLTDNLLKEMAKNTNSYAAEKRGDNEDDDNEEIMRTWKDVTPEEIGQWLGIVLYMGVHVSPAVADYWKHDGMNPSHPITQWMSQTRYEQIKRYFHVASPDAELFDKDRKKRLWHAKVDPVLDQLRKSSKAYRMPSSNVAVDEAMIRCTGRSIDTYKMPSKPIEQGFKFHCLADAGYLYDFLPTSNKEGLDPVPTIPGLTPTGCAVYHLVHQLQRSKYWALYTDNFYTTLALYGRLRHDFKVGACGTARPSSTGFPTELKVPKQQVSNYDYHSTKPMVLRDPTFQEPVGALLWFDNAPVTLMTTIHRLDATVDRVRQKPGAKSTNAKQSGPAFGENQQLEMPIPECVDDYNHFMGGVDRADQLRCYYDCQQTSRRTWWPILFWALDTMVTNAYIIFCDVEGVPKLSHKEFRLQCAWPLIYSGPAPKVSTSNRPAARNVKSSTELPLERLEPHGHLPVHSETKKACWLCRWKRRDEGASKNLPQTRWTCKKCEISLCLSGERNCFEEYHES